MALFDSLVQQLQNRETLPPLVPTQLWNDEISQQVAAADNVTLFGAGSSSSTRADACRAGLLLWNDDLDASHDIAQHIDDATGSFWHAIMHRREGDYANANYWWRRTGTHPAFSDVHEAVLNTLQTETSHDAQAFVARLQSAGSWQPIEFVACCERAQRRADDAWLRRSQVAEMSALLNWCRSENG
ncbi:MAG TPA: hypothetical protein VF600_02900 [Abditibacteriaceae bacterium]|jgi:hypothetical protein